MGSEMCIRDRRKGILAGAVGLGLTLFSMLDDGTPNSIGLILLFVGGGYCVLWWFEARHSTPPTGGSGSTGNTSQAAANRCPPSSASHRAS